MLVAVMLLLVGCGNKGDLYMPEKDEVPKDNQSE